MIDAGYYASLPHGSYPIDIRVFEKSGRSYDFFGDILYR
jgi:hypothetical protein